MGERLNRITRKAGDFIDEVKAVTTETVEDAKGVVGGVISSASAEASRVKQNLKKNFDQVRYNNAIQYIADAKGMTVEEVESRLQDSTITP